MGHHDAYGKAVLRDAVGTAFDEFGLARRFTFGNCRGWADIDGVLADDIAVEIESRNSKQVRGAVLDLIWHPYPKKVARSLAVRRHVKTVRGSSAGTS